MSERLPIRKKALAKTHGVWYNNKAWTRAGRTADPACPSEAPVNYLLLALSLTAGILKNIFSKAANGKSSTFGGMININILTAILGILVFSAGNPFRIAGDAGLFLLLAFLYGLFTVGSQTFFMIAVRGGEVSVSSIIYSSNFIIPSFFAVIAYHEAVSAPRLIGMGLMLLAIVLVSGNPGQKKLSKAVAYAVAAMLCSACVGIIQKVFGATYGNGESTMFLFCAFVSVLLVSLLLKLVPSKDGTKQTKEADADDGGRTKRIVFKLILALCVVVANKLNLYLSAALPAMIFFPVLNGGTVVFSAMVSALLFGEKLTARKLLALPAVLAGVILFAL